MNILSATASIQPVNVDRQRLQAPQAAKDRSGCFNAYIKSTAQMLPSRAAVAERLGTAKQCADAFFEGVGTQAKYLADGVESVRRVIRDSVTAQASNAHNAHTAEETEILMQYYP